MTLRITITDQGRAAVINAPNTGTAAVTITQVGLSETAVTPHVRATTLPDEFKRISTLAGAVTADDTIHVEVTDSGADAYSIRSVALYLSDGTLFAIYGQADPILTKTASSVMALPIDIVLEDISATSITFGNLQISNPAATTEQQGVVELATQAEATAGTDTLRALTPARAKAAVLSWLITQDGSGSGLDADLLRGMTPDQVVTAARVVAGLGYTPLDTTAYTAADVLAKLITVDGSGSGLDADLLRGLTPDQVVTSARVIAGLGFTPLNATAYTAADVLAKLLTVDGAASGLDADTLDGRHASAFPEKVSTNRPGLTRLYRRDDDSGFSVQHHFDGSRWWLRGYNADDTHNAECRVGYADVAGSVPKLATTTGDAPTYAARAWVNFNGTGAVGAAAQIRSSGNISSVTKLATGDYRVNFATAMPDENYAAFVQVKEYDSEGHVTNTTGFIGAGRSMANSMTKDFVRAQSIAIGSGFWNSVMVSVVVFR